MPELKDVKDTMKFDLRMFMETLLEMIEALPEEQRGVLVEYILDQAEYARDCKVID